MRSFELTVPEGLAEQLETERELLGFQSVDEYVRWIVERRTAIETDSDRNRVLSAYAERVAELEARLDGSADADPMKRAPDAASESPASERSTGENSANESVASERAASENPASEGTAVDAGSERAASAATTTAGEDSASADGEFVSTGSESAPDDTAATESDAATAESDAGAAESDAETETGADGDREDDTDREDDAGRGDDADRVDHNLAPGTARISDDTVNELASELAGVEGERLDAFVRDAVARTGKRLDGSPESGIAYSSRTSVGAGGERPGEEITDLDALEVPGYDEDLVARRRVAVGAALAFLRDAESARRGDFVEELYESYPAGYETADSWWGCVKRGLEQVDRVVPAGEHSRTWRFRTTPGRVTRLPSRR